MNPFALTRPRWAPLVAGAALVVACTHASAQSHETREHGYVLRSSTVPSEAVSVTALKAQGIDPAPGRAVLNVLVQREGGSGPGAAVAADVTAEITTLSGRRSTIDLREVAEGGGISYIGAYDVLPRQVVDFTITARPAESGVSLSLSYRDRVWAR